MRGNPPLLSDLSFVNFISENDIRRAETHKKRLVNWKMDNSVHEWRIVTKVATASAVVFLFLFGTYLISLSERWMGVFSIDWEIVFRNFILTKTCTTGSVFFGSFTFPQEVTVWQDEKVKLFKLFLPRFVRTSLIRNNLPNLLSSSPLFKNSTRQLWWWRRSYQDEAAYITLHCNTC